MKRNKIFALRVVVLSILCSMLLAQSSFTISSAANVSLGFTPADTVSHPTKPIVYLTDKVNKKLYSVNHATGETLSISFNLMPESLTFANNEVYVCLLKAEHSLYTPESSQAGAIAVIYPDTLTIKEQFDISMDPYDIAVGSDGYIYITSGSGQWTQMKAYQKRMTASTGIRTRSYGEMHPTLGRVYTVTTDSSPRDYVAFNTSSGVFTDPAYPGGYDSPYHGDYPLNKNFRISPDGKYLFNGSGVIFNAAVDKANDMKYYAKIDKSFTDIAFDLSNNQFFIGTAGGYIYIYDYNTLALKSIYCNSALGIEKLFYKTGKLIALRKSSTGAYSVDSLTVAGNRISTSKRTSIGFAPADVVIHPSKSMVYLTDKSSKKLYSVDYDLGTASNITLSLTPESLAFENNEIYAGLLKAEHNFYIPDEQQQGAVAVVNPDTFTLKEQFDVDIDPFDVIPGKDGVLYITSGSGQWAQMKAYLRSPQRGTASTGIRTQSFAYMHPSLNRVYTITTDTSPRDYYAFNVAGGKFTDPTYPGGYDSPYHGDYPLNKNFRISTDGKYLFNGSGVIFTSDAVKANDMRYFGKLNQGFNDIAFDVSNGRFFTGALDGSVYKYSYSTLQPTKLYTPQGTVLGLYYQNSKLVSILKTTSGCTVETVAVIQ